VFIDLSCFHWIVPTVLTWQYKHEFLKLFLFFIVIVVLGYNVAFTKVLTIYHS
jgi:hypothetical protein